MNSRPAIRLRHHGLSLTELLLGLAIGALLLAPLPSLLQSAGASARVAADQVALEREADFALERIAARIRATAPAAGRTDKPSSEWFKPVVYSVAEGVLVEQEGKDSYVLAESVTGFAMSVSSSEAGLPLIKVSLGLAREGGASTTAVAAVRLGSAL